MGSGVELWHLDGLVAEVPFPLQVTAHLVLPEDVADQVSWEGNGRDSPHTEE